jgi:hypothetical protein
MLVLIRLHNRPVPALFIPILNWYIVGGNMLRMRAIYIHSCDTDYQGMPTIGQQLFRFIISIEDGARLQFSWCLGSHKGYLGHILDARFKIGLNYRLCYKMKRLGGLAIYNAWQNMIYKLFSPSRREHSYTPYWHIETKTNI